MNVTPVGVPRTTSPGRTVTPPIRTGTLIPPSVVSRIERSLTSRLVTSGSKPFGHGSADVSAGARQKDSHNCVSSGDE
jgi:hypothetical protein